MPKFISLSTFLIILFFAGCAFQTQKLIQQEETVSSFVDKKDDVELNIQVTPETEKQSYFHKFIPLHIQIKNKSQNSYILSPKDIGLPLVSFKEISEKVPNVVLSYFIPSAVFVAGGIFFLWEVCLPLAAVSAIGSLWGGRVTRKNALKKLRQNVLATEDDAIEIKSNEKVDKLIFVKKQDYKFEFILKLINTTDQTELPFDVCITTKNNTFYKLK